LRLRRGLIPLVLFVVAVVIAFIVQLVTGVDRHGASVTTLTIDSKAVGRPLPTTVVIPAARPEQGKRPLLVFLHGRNGNERSELDDAFYSALEAAGPGAPIVAFPYGGKSSYWHDRADGRWGRYVTREVIPEVVRRFDADPRRVAIGGISMGGFGAYDIARLNPGRFCAVAGHSPALWGTGGETAPGAFDDAEDFARHDVVGAAQANPDLFGDAHVWLDAAAADPFQPGDQPFAGALGKRASIHLSWPGGHEDSYWNAHWPAYARFYTRALANCR
jgi:S-formylglutathione hydrolase FrmB